MKVVEAAVAELRVHLFIRLLGPSKTTKDFSSGRDSYQGHSEYKSKRYRFSVFVTVNGQVITLGKEMTNVYAK